MDTKWGGVEVDASFKERLQAIKRKQVVREGFIRGGLGEYSVEELALLLTGIEILYNDRVFGDLECLPWMRMVVYGLLWGRKGDEHTAIESFNTLKRVSSFLTKAYNL